MKIKLGRLSVPGVYENNGTRVVVMETTNQNGYVLLDGTARQRIVPVTSLKGEYQFVKTLDRTKVEIV